MSVTKLDEIRKAIEKLTLEEKIEFISEIVPQLCDEFLTRETCREVFERKLSVSRYLESLEQLDEMQNEQ